MNDIGWRSVLVMTITALVCVEARATPTGADLASTCARALAAGYGGLEAGICDWYVVPCPVCGAAPQPQTACPPAGIDHAGLARVVVAALATRNDAAARPAPELVAAILTATYPCANETSIPTGSR